MPVDPTGNAVYYTPWQKAPQSVSITLGSSSNVGPKPGFGQALKRPSFGFALP